MSLVLARPAPWWGRNLGIPTRRLVALWAVPLAGAVVCVVAPGALAPLLAIDLVLVVVAAVDLWRCRATLAVGREVAPVQAVGRPFDVVVRVADRGGRGADLRVADEAPGRADGLPQPLRLGAGQSAEVRYTLVIDDRGQADFGDVVLRWGSPLGLWERQARFSVPGGVRVYPDFEPLRSGSLVARAAEERVPVRVRRRPGGENEFQRLRPYVPGDPYRHIDWKATARKREYVTREFGQESNQNLIFMIDAGRMMSARSGDLTLFDHALNAAVMMGQVALRHGDRVGLLAYDREVRVWLPPKGGARQGAALIRSTYDLQPTLDEPDVAKAFRHLTGRVRRRSLVVLLTAMVDEVNADLASRVGHALALRHLPLVVWLRDAEVDALLERPPTGPDDLWVRAAASELLGWRERALAGLRKRGALVIDTRPEALSLDLLGRYLEIKARRLL